MRFTKAQSVKLLVNGVLVAWKHAGVHGFWECEGVNFRCHLRIGRGDQLLQLIDVLQLLVLSLLIHRLLNDLDQHIHGNQLRPLIVRAFGAIDYLLEPFRLLSEGVRLRVLLDLHQNLTSLLERLKLWAISPHFRLFLQLFAHPLVKIVEGRDTLDELSIGSI